LAVKLKTATLNLYDFLIEPSESLFRFGLVWIFSNQSRNNISAG
jgi:hypothetical protein